MTLKPGNSIGRRFAALMWRIFAVFLGVVGAVVIGYMGYILLLMWAMRDFGSNK
ncbi:MAG: hypothetical protein R3A49_07685 [Acidimicrobiia bacterium]